MKMDYTFGKVAIVLLLVILAVSFIIIKETAFSLLRRIYLLIFKPDILVREANKEIKTSDSNQMKENINKVRNNIFRAFRITIGTVVFSIIIYMLLHFLGIHPGHRLLIISRFFGYALILWGIFSPTGWGIQTICGTTLPEIIDEEFHRLIYMGGLFFLLLSYLFEV